MREASNAREPMIRSFTVVALMCMTSSETATAVDLKTVLKDLMPCKYAPSQVMRPPPNGLCLPGGIGAGGRSPITWALPNHHP